MIELAEAAVLQRRRAEIEIRFGADEVVGGDRDGVAVAVRMRRAERHDQESSQQRAEPCMVMALMLAPVQLTFSTSGSTHALSKNSFFGP